MNSKQPLGLAILLFSFHLLYSAILCSVPELWSSYVTLPYLAGSFFLFFKALGTLDHSTNTSKRLPSLLLFGLVVHLGLILGATFSENAAQVLWVTDSLEIHVPGAKKVMSFLTGQAVSEQTSLYDRTYLAHVIAGLFFTILGANPFASALSLIVPKLLTLLVIFKTGSRFFNERVATISSLLYLFLPTALFYTLVFYKEATVQLLVALMIYLIFWIDQKIAWVTLAKMLLLIVVLGALGLERHYLLPCYAVGLLVYSLTSHYAPLWLRVSVIAVCGLGYKVFTAYYTDLNLQSLKKTLVAYRQIFLSYPDVSPINEWLPYPLAVIKLLLTPIFTPSKIETFPYFASLLTWGGFFHQALIVIFILAVIRLIKQKSYRVIILSQLTPFIVLLGVFGYIAPYSGRLRDSFLPLIVLLAAYEIDQGQTFKKIKAKLIKKSS